MASAQWRFGRVELSVSVFVEEREDVEVCWWLRLAAGCIVSR